MSMSSVAARQPPESATNTEHEAALDALKRREAMFAEEDGRRARRSRAAPLAPDRKPLGLRPVSDAADPGASPGPQDPLLALISEGHAALFDAVEQLQEQVQQKIASLETQLGAMKNENTSLRLILENLRITQRGERGIDGDRGPPGRDGQQGPIGPVGQTGARGSRGQPGDRIVAWRLSPEEFLAYPIAETGKELPPLNLMPFFTEYNTATEASEVDLATAALGVQRADLELRTERTRQGLAER